MKYVKVIIKIQELKYIKELQAGKLYMNHIDYFKNIEQDQGRKDIHEGLDKCFQPSKSKLIIGDHEINSDDIVNPIFCEKSSPDFQIYFAFLPLL